MKRIIFIFLSVLLISSSAFSRNFFSERFFEVETTTEAGASNNLITLNEVFVKNPVIDFNNINNSLPSQGFILNSFVNENIAFNLNLPFIKVGINSGVEVTEQADISKQLFELLAKGYDAGDSVEVSIKNYSDAFLYSNVKVGLKIGRFFVEGQPALFVPVFSSAGTAASITAKNGSDGSVYAVMAVDMDYYSPFNIRDFNTLDAASIMEGAGFDFAGAVQIPINYHTTVKVKGRIPVVPGKFNTVYHETLEYSVQTKVQDIIDASSDEKKKVDDVIDKKQSDEKFTKESTVYYINRPMVAMAYVNYKPFGLIVDLCAGAGLGIYHPFMETAKFYPQYYFGATANLADILKFTVSTEYMSQLFKHQAKLTVNVRVLEVQTGVSVQSPTFTKSFSGYGFGAYVLCAFGF